MVLAVRVVSPPLGVMGWLPSVIVEFPGHTHLLLNSLFINGFYLLV